MRIELFWMKSGENPMNLGAFGFSGYWTALSWLCARIEKSAFIDFEAHQIGVGRTQQNKGASWTRSHGIQDLEGGLDPGNKILQMILSKIRRELKFPSRLVL